MFIYLCLNHPKHHVFFMWYYTSRWTSSWGMKLHERGRLNEKRRASLAGSWNEEQILHDLPHNRHKLDLKNQRLSKPSALPRRTHALLSMYNAISTLRSDTAWMHKETNNLFIMWDTSVHARAGIQSNGLNTITGGIVGRRRDLRPATTHYFTPSLPAGLLTTSLRIFRPRIVIQMRRRRRGPRDSHRKPRTVVAFGQTARMCRVSKTVLIFRELKNFFHLEFKGYFYGNRKFSIRYIFRSDFYGGNLFLCFSVPK